MARVSDYEVTVKYVITVPAGDIETAKADALQIIHEDASKPEITIWKKVQ